MVIAVIIAAAIGVLVGCFIMNCIQFKERNEQFIGNLRIDTSDPDGPYAFLESHTSIENIMQKKYVVLRVEVKDYISHD